VGLADFLLFTTALVAFSISAVCGGGAGLLLIPILGTILPVSQVPAALTIGTATSSLSRLWVFSKSIRWEMTIRFVPASLLGATMGAELLSYLEPMYIELCMGIFLVSNLPSLLGRQKETESIPPRSIATVTVAIIGMTAGVISALTGAVGVLFNRFYVRCGLSPQEIIATRAANEILLHVYKLFLYRGLGLFELKTLGYGLVVALAAIASSRVMKYVLPKLSREVFSRIGFSSMVLIGIMMLNSSLLHIRVSADPNLRLNHLAGEMEATLTWNKLAYSFEFNYGEGPEYEKVIPLSSLSIGQQEYLMSVVEEYDSILVEKVYSLAGLSYEANFLGPDQKLIKKVEFD
jgi:uncharacterized membrane protein YfcA